ncbi:oxysterol-binding protein-related protein 8-like isoform X2 [Gigantopelta aegis]|nr:oxysterol-binding protein-related protein 8-like isoform X2 [Gigantopelta aegis]
MSSPSTAQSPSEHSVQNVRTLSDSLLSNSEACNKMSKRESLKALKKSYRTQKKLAAQELLSTLKDPSVIVLADWLKIRGTLKSWTKLWCVLKPGLLVLYKNEKQKSSNWVGTVLLNTCQLIERPSKKDGFCFKLFHPLDQSIWATKGPKGETIGAFVQPLPYNYLIFRAPSEGAGKCWMDALELALRCTSLLMRTMTKDKDISSSAGITPSLHTDTVHLDESDLEKHFEGQGLGDDKADRDAILSETDTSQSEVEDETFDESVRPEETVYRENEAEDLGQQGDSTQTEEVDDENKSLIWSLVKQVRPGMDLSKVVLPTFILEPRSFLDKLSDYYYHADILSEAVLHEDPYTRIKDVTRWYLSGFYKKPKGLKKPYNPIIGEKFRCYWYHPKTDSRTFYIAEQISHHPPISAFHVTNRKDGFNISTSILAKSKFYGNSLSAVLDSTVKLSFLKRGEDYYITMPYAHCKGILIGTLTMEMGGKVSIDCPKTGYRADLEFKLKPFLGSGEASNRIVGKLKVGTDTLATIEGHWDQEIFIKEKDQQTLFWNPTPEIKQKRLKRFTVPIEIQEDMESENLWRKVSDAVITGDMYTATQEKYVLEERQRQEAKQRKSSMSEWMPLLFEQDIMSGAWVYKQIDMRPWDPSNDVIQYEKDFVVRTHTRHKTPVVRTMSITSLHDIEGGVEAKTSSYLRSQIRLPRGSISSKRHRVISGSSSEHMHDSDSSGCLDIPSSMKIRHSDERLIKIIDPLIQSQKEITRSMHLLQKQVAELQYAIGNGWFSMYRDWLVLAVVLTFQVFLQWYINR